MLDNLLLSFAAVLAGLPSAPTSFESSAQVTTEMRAPIVGAWRLELNDDAKQDAKKRVQQVNKEAEDTGDTGATKAIADDVLLAGDGEEVDALSTPEISYHTPSANCTEDYNFQPDGKILVVSDTEWTYGEYEIINKSSAKLPILILKTTYDNNNPDCSGVKRDQSGESFAAYLSQESSNRFKLCNKDTAKDCFMTFERILP